MWETIWLSGRVGGGRVLKKSNRQTESDRTSRTDVKVDQPGINRTRIKLLSSFYPLIQKLNV